jgi:DNA mismatch repair protein MutS2
MHPGALRALEFDRIVSVVTGFALTPTGEARLAELRPLTDQGRVIAAQRATSEGARFLASNPGFPLRAPADLEAILDALGVEGRPLEPLRLLGLADYLESIEQARSAIAKLGSSFPILTQLVQAVASFKSEIADIRRKIDPAGEVADDATPALASIRDRLRRQKARLRSTLESFLRGRETSKYLQDQVVTDRNGRYVLVVRAEHRSAIPGIIHGASASGASLFLEPLSTVEINNDIVAIEEQEAEEVRRILSQLTNALRSRPADLRRTLDVATELDVIQAKAHFSLIVGGIEPAIAGDSTFELRGARHPLLIRKVNERLQDGRVESTGSDSAQRNEPVPVDVLLIPPTRILVITGPNTGGKTVALKTAGLLALMSQAGLHIPAEHGSRLPVFRSIFADIGDEQSISASLSTFSGHIANVVSMDRDLQLPALVLLDEVGAGTDPVEGGALGTAVIDHFRQRGAHLVATTHYDALKSYASTTEAVQSAAFGFNAETFAPTYQLIYGSPGRSLAIEIAARLGMPATIIAAARSNLGDREKQLADHLAKMDNELRALEHERRLVAREREALTDTDVRIRAREDAIRQREQTVKQRIDKRLDEQLRDAKREIDAVIESLKTRAAEMTTPAARLVTHTISTGDAGAARSDARAAVERVVERFKEGAAPAATAPEPRLGTVAEGARVAVGALGLEGIVIRLQDGQAEVDVRGKRLRAPLKDLRVLGVPAGPSAAAPRVKVNVDLQPRSGSLSDLNVIGCTVDEAITRAEKFLDETTVTDQRTVRLIHGYGTGQLRRALQELLKDHPLVASFHPAPQDQGGGGVTVVELKD